MIQTNIPLSDGAIGNLNDRLRSVTPTQLGNVRQMSSGSCYDTGGFLLSDLTFEPKQRTYKGLVVFQIWERRGRSVERLVASITVDADTHEYAVKMEQPNKYPKLIATFQLGDDIGRPYRSIIYRNPSHNADWVFDVTL